jgi:hypothetical protein
MSTHDSRGSFGTRGQRRRRRLALGTTVVGLALTFAITGCTSSKGTTSTGAGSPAAGATTASATETAGGTPPVTGLQKSSSPPPASW